MSVAFIFPGQGAQVTGMGRDFYEQTDSTNNCIRKLAKEGKKEGVVAVAEIQTAGKGRRGKGWQSPKGTGIWMSMLLTPNITPPEAPLLTLLAGLAVCRAIRQQTALEAKIKWPNDILIAGKKVCGILTELDAEILRETVSNVTICSKRQF